MNLAGPSPPSSSYIFDVVGVKEEHDISKVMVNLLTLKNSLFPELLMSI